MANTLTNGYCDSVTNNINQVCQLNRGGLKLQIYAANLGQISAISGTVAKEIDTITMATNPATTQPYYWYKLVFKTDSASFNNEGVFDNNTYVNQSVSFAVDGLTKETLEVLEGMMTGNAVFIVKDFNNKAYVLGRIGGLKMSSMALGSGTAAGDRFGGEITFTGAETETVNTIEPGTTIQVWDGVSATTTVTL